MSINILYCDQSSEQNFPQHLSTDICSITAVKWEITAVACFLLTAVGAYILKKWKYRCHKTLLTFHNLRAAVALLLLSINTLELARACLPTTTKIAATATPTAIPLTVVAKELNNNGENMQNNGYGETESNLQYPVPSAEANGQEEAEMLNDRQIAVLVIGISLIWNAFIAILFTITLMCYHRIVELKKLTEFLYVSSTLEAIIFILRIYELAEIVYERFLFELEPSLQASTALCLLSLAIIDGFTIYKERYRPDYLEDYEKIGYKHTLATFYSKACFFWLSPLLWFGYKEPLELEDLGQMRVEDSARAHYDQFLLIYKTAKVKNSDRPPSLWLCYFKCCWRMFTLGGLFKLFGDLFSLIGPLAIQQIVKYIEIMYETHIPKHNVSNRNELPQMNNINDFNTSNSNNNNSSITLKGLRGQLNNSLITASNKNIRRLLNYLVLAITNENKIEVNMQYGIIGKSNEGISIRETGKDWFQNSLTDDYYYDYGDDDDDVSSVADVAAAAIDVQIYYPTWLDLLSNGWAIAWIVLLAALAQGALSQASTHMLNITGIRIKTSLQGLIYRKTLLLNASCIDPCSDVSGRCEVSYGDAERNSSTNTLEIENKENLTDDDVNNGNENERNYRKRINGNRSQKNNQVDKGMDSDSNNVGAITNLMSEDTLNIMSFFWIAHYVWAIPLKIGVVMYLLYNLLGVSAVIGSFVCILTMTPLQFLIGKAMSNNTETMAQFTDERLKRIHETFVGIKLIKLNAWDDVFLRKIGEARARELKYLNKDSIYWTLMTILTHISTVLITFVTLAVYTSLERDSNEFVASHLFSALALFQQLTVPLLIFPITVPIIISAVISTRRLERFLYASEIQKQFEGIRNMARILSKSDASLDMYEIKDKSASLPANVSIGDGQQQQQMQQQNKLNERIALKINVPGAPAPLAHSEPHTPLSLYEVNTSTGFNFQLTNDENNKSALSVDALQSYKWHETREKRLSVQRRELLRNTPYVVIRPRKTGHNIAHTPHMPLSKKYSDSFSHRESLLLKMPDDMAVSVKQATFAWNPQRMEHVLHIKDISIPKGRLTMILGKNGSGKSSLLAALLMEMPLVSGDMIWNKTSTIAYVPQQPWLLNASIRDNILFGESFRPKRYDFVLEACALKPDIELMPNGDLTVIGERGINLSGGQRQRVAIARALYSSANVVIMDDPLSSLDNEVARHIFEQSIKKMLLKANRTVLLVTQQLQLVQQTDYLIVMKDGRLQASGTYKEIEMNHPHIITKWNSIIAKVNEQLREQENEHNQLGRTARERWKLFKNVTRIGLQRSISASAASASAPKTQMASEYGVGGITSFQLNGTNGNGILDDEDDVLPATSSTHNPLRMSQSLGNFSLTRKRSSVYGSRHLIYDVPLPIDECQTEDVIMRRGRRRGTSQRLSMQQQQHERHQKHEISQEYQNQQQLQQQYQQQQQRPDSLRTSWNSSRFSGISNASTELPHSLLTASYSSATSCDSNNSNTNASCMTILDSINNDGYEQQQFERQQRVQSWQPQSSSMPIHAPVKRNVSSPSSLPTATNSSSPSQNSNGSIVQDTYENSEDNNDVDETSNEATKTSDADLVADIVKSSKVDGGFQQFLQRMSMRRSNKPTVSTVHRIHLPVSATNSILSISEETSTTPTTPISPVPAAELSFQAMAAEFNASGEIDNESHFDDRCISNKLPELQPMAATLGDCKILVNNANTCYNVTENLSAAVIYACKNTKPSTMNDPMQTANDSGENVDSLNVIKTITTTEKTHKATAKERVTPQQTIMMTASKSLPTSTPLLPMLTDVERKYGKISTQIYLLYLRASGFSIVLIFFISALIWQGLRIYTDIWLQHWTDDSIVSGNLKNFKTISPTPASSNVSFLLTTMLLSSTSSPSYMPSAHHEVTYYFRVYTIISCVCILMAMISTPAGQLAGCNARRHLHDKLLKTIMRKSLHFFQVTPLGRIMNRFSYDMAIIDKKIAATSQRLLQFTLLCLCAILINVSITPWFILLTLPICGAYYAIQKFYRSSSRELQRIENATNSPVISHLTETIQGVTTIRAYNQEARFTEILFKRLEANTIAFTILNTSNRWLGISLDYLGGIIVFVAILTALVTANITCKKWENYDDNKNNSTATATPSPSLVGLAINYTLLVPIYLNWVVKLLADMEMYIGSVERIAYYADSDLQKTSKTIRVTHDEITKTDNGEEENDSDDAVANVCLRRTNQATQTSVDQNILNSSGRNSIANATKSLAVVNEKLADADTSRIVIERTDAERCTSLRRLSNFGKHYKSVPISWPKRGDISFENVSLRYEGQQEDIIKNLTLKIPAGQKVGICGRTGSGKSSLALSLFGVLQTTSGRICIDDVDITQIHPDEIRTRLSIIPQDVHLFSATIRENLDPAGYYADLALWNCLEMAQLKEFVNAQMPMGLDTEITDGGRNLSAGHRQLFCLARAILRGSVCLVLDEATSSLDSSTEKSLLATAHKAFKGRTIVTIAHRLSTILDYDRIIVLEYGKIVEDGKPQELQRKPNGVFGALLQSGRPLSATLSESGVVLQELIQHNPNQ